MTQIDVYRHNADILVATYHGRFVPNALYEAVAPYFEDETDMPKILLIDCINIMVTKEDIAFVKSRNATNNPMIPIMEKLDRHVFIIPKGNSLRRIALKMYEGTHVFGKISIMESMDSFLKS